MKIAVVIDTWFPAIGGGQINAWEISKRIAGKHYQIDIITRDNGKDNLTMPKYLKVIKLGAKSNPESPLSKIIFSASLVPFLLTHDYQLIHVHPFLPAPFVKSASFIKKVPVVITVHGTRLFENRKIFTPSLIMEWFILTRIKYDLVISVTEVFKKIKNINSNIQVVRNGIDFKMFENIKVEKASHPKILWVGRFDKVKKVENLIIAMEHVIQKVPNAKLTLVGYGYEENNLKKLTKKLNLNKHVEFAGKKTGDDLIREYKNSHLFAICSDSEGQPLSILEAQAACLPVVATKTGGIPEIVKDSVNGLLVAPNDYIALATAIFWCLKNKNDFGKRGHLKVAKMNNWDDIAKKTLSVYKNVTKDV